MISLGCMGDQWKELAHEKKGHILSLHLEGCVKYHYPLYRPWVILPASVETTAVPLILSKIEVLP